MNTNVMRCIGMKINIVKELQLGATKIKFCDSLIAKTDEERKRAIKEFKQVGINLLKSRT